MSSYEQLITFGVLSAPKLTWRNRFSLAFGRLYINHDREAKTTGSSMSIHAKLIFWCSKMNEFEQNYVHYMDKSTWSPTLKELLSAMKLLAHRFVPILIPEEGWSSITVWLRSCGFT